MISRISVTCKTVRSRTASGVLRRRGTGAQRGHVADDPGHGAGRRAPRSATPRRSSTATAGSASPRSSAMVADAARALLAAGDRARRPGRGLGAELARVDRRRARRHHGGRRARPGEHPLPGRRGGVRARPQRRPARCSPSAASSTPTTRRCSRAPVCALPALAHTVLSVGRRPTTHRSGGTTSSPAATPCRPARPRRARRRRSAPTTRATSCSRRARPASPRAW